DRRATFPANAADNPAATAAADPHAGAAPPVAISSSRAATGQAPTSSKSGDSSLAGSDRAPSEPAPSGPDPSGPARPKSQGGPCSPAEPSAVMPSLASSPDRMVRSGRWPAPRPG